MSNISTELDQRMLFEMLRIRMVEETISDLYSEQEMRCPVHLSIGQEAAAVGVCTALSSKDWAFSGHRNHAHYLAKGGNLNKMLAEIYGKSTGCCGGKGGSMHLNDQEAGFLGATPIVGSTVPIAVGAALTVQLKNELRTVVVFLGDGAMETGVVHESLNFAVLKTLPILFVCENNLYSVYSPLSVRQPSHRLISELAEGHGITSFQANGNDVKAVHQTTQKALKLIQAKKGPVFIELQTYRWREHCGPNYDNDIGYRTEDEFLRWKGQDPIELMKSQNSSKTLERTSEEIRSEIHSAITFAKQSPFPSTNTINENVYA